MCIYKQIAGTLEHSSKHLLKKSGNYNKVPDWNEYCNMTYETVCTFYVEFPGKTKIQSKF